MTLTQASAVMVLLRGQLASHAVLAVEGLAGDLGQFVVMTPPGVPMSVELALPHALPLTRAELTALVVRAESRIRELMTPFEGAAGRGFSDIGRGVQKPGVRGLSANDGAV